MKKNKPTSLSMNALVSLVNLWIGALESLVIMFDGLLEMFMFLIETVLLFFLLVLITVGGTAALLIAAFMGAIVDVWNIIISKT